MPPNPQSSAGIESAILAVAAALQNKKPSAGADYVAASENRTTTTYGDLATVGPTVTVNVGESGCVLVALATALGNGGGYAQMSFAASGANTVAASDTRAIAVTGTTQRIGSTFLLTGLLPGITTITAKYNATAGTANFFDRRVAAVAL